MEALQLIVGTAYTVKLCHNDTIIPPVSVSFSMTVLHQHAVKVDS